MEIYSSDTVVLSLIVAIVAKEVRKLLTTYIGTWSSMAFVRSIIMEQGRHRNVVINGICTFNN